MTRALTQQARVRTNTTRDSVCSISVPAVTFAQLWAAYPGGHPYVDANGKTPAGYENQCAINLSAAIHGAGIEMKSFRGATVTLLNGRRAATSASQLANWLKQQPFCGLPMAPENVAGDGWQDKIKGRTGIVYFEDYWARNEQEKAANRPTGDHIDLWNGARLTAVGWEFFSAWGRRIGVNSFMPGTDRGYSDVRKATAILFWEVK
jgi:hypothetical protein